MKKIFYTTISLFFLGGAVSAQTFNIKQLAGRWESAEGGGLEVIDSSRIYIVYGNEKKQIAHYKADFSKTPVSFDFTVNDDGHEISMKSLLLLVNGDLLQWQVFEGDAKPVHFTADNGDMIYMKRKK